LPLQFLAAWIGVWLGRVLQEQVDYLKAENLQLREKLGTKRVRLTDAERRRLAMLGKALGRKGLAAIATIASPETILRWYRELVAKKYDGSQQRGQGRPKTAADIAAIIVKMASENSWGQAGVKTVRLPAHSPNLNAFAERFVLSIKIECLERLVPLGERHLRLAIAEYMRHYHLERNHQGLANALIYGGAQAVAGNGAVACRERLDGLLKFYHRETA
jgi:transposase InsO family protein